jgi:hypothetical protein
MGDRERDSREVAEGGAVEPEEDYETTLLKLLVAYLRTEELRLEFRHETVTSMRNVVGVTPVQSVFSAIRGLRDNPKKLYELHNDRARERLIRVLDTFSDSEIYEMLLEAQATVRDAT